jgi:hypothetical protein
MTLSVEEKQSLIGQHQRSMELNKYNLELALIQENALTTPNASTVSSLEDQISDCDKKLAALAAELSQLNS